MRQNDTNFCLSMMTKVSMHLTMRWVLVTQMSQLVSSPHLHSFSTGASSQQHLQLLTAQVLEVTLHKTPLLLRSKRMKSVESV